MRAVIVGAGPAGLLLAAGLRRRGHDVTLVDRDTGPGHDGVWRRRGVMQFGHAHLFRRQVVEQLQAEAPAAWARWLELGAAPQSPPGAPPGMLMGVRSRRETFERALRESVLAQLGVVVRHGHARGVVVTDGTATGVDVDGEVLSAELVVDATGRSGSLTADLPERAGFGGPCGIAYVDRKFRLRPGADPGPLSHPMLLQLSCDGYEVLVFPHEHDLFSAVVVRPAADPDLKHLRHDAAYDAVCRAVPGLAEWTDPARSEPLGPVLPGAHLVNVYRSQHAVDGTPPPTGLVWVGDAVATTTPTFGRGVALAFTQVRGLLDALDEHADLDAVRATYDAWCEREVAPWVRDHVEVDGGLARRWRGEPVDLDARLPSDLVLEAGRVDPSIMTAGAPYLAMSAGPDVLDAARPAAAAVLATGWRPEPDPGPSRDELARLVLAAV